MWRWEDSLEPNNISAPHTHSAHLCWAAKGGGLLGGAEESEWGIWSLWLSLDAIRARDYKTGKYWSCPPPAQGGLELQLTSLLVNPGCLNEPQRSSLPFPWAHSRTQIQAHTLVSVQQQSRRKRSSCSCWLWWSVTELGASYWWFARSAFPHQPRGLRGRYHSNDPWTNQRVDSTTLQRTKPFPLTEYSYIIFPFINAFFLLLCSNDSLHCRESLELYNLYDFFRGCFFRFINRSIIPIHSLFQFKISIPSNSRALNRCWR